MTSKSEQAETGEGDPDANTSGVSRRREIIILLAAQAFSGLSPQLRDEAAGLFNLTKTLGFAAGTTLVATLVYRGSQVNWHAQVGMLNQVHPGYRHYLQTSGLTDHSLQAGAELGSLLQTQTGMVAMIQTMEVLAVLALCAMPLALLLRSAEPEPMEIAH